MKHHHITAEQALEAVRPVLNSIRYDCDNQRVVVGETWRVIPVDQIVGDRYRVRSDYYASSLGRLRRVDHATGETIDLTGSITSNGYTRITVGHRRSQGGRTYPCQMYAHRLVCWAWHGAPPQDREQVRHINGNKQDNRPENLAWGNQADNYADAVRLGELPPRVGGKLGRPCLSADQAASLRRDVATTSQLYVEIADRYGVSVATVAYHRRRSGTPRRRPETPVRTA